ALITRISLAGLRTRVLTFHDLRLLSLLCGVQRHRLATNLRRYSLELEHHSARLHHRHPSFRRAFPLAHAGLGGLLGDRLVGEDSDPDLATTLDVPRQSDTRRFGLPIRDPARLHRL